MRQPIRLPPGSAAKIGLIRVLTAAAMRTVLVAARSVVFSSGRHRGRRQTDRVDVEQSVDSSHQVEAGISQPHRRSMGENHDHGEQESEAKRGREIERITRVDMLMTVRHDGAERSPLWAPEAALLRKGWG
jgi:hypothetical protein